jgi:tetratricopeptide (TPR) repeat protein
VSFAALVALATRGSSASAAGAGGDAAEPRPATGSWQSSGSAEELLREAREHESRQDDFVAIRRYSEAISLDPNLGEAYLGLGALRLRRGDPREAERVYEAALARLPGFGPALMGRAEALWALGERAQAEADLETYARSSEDPGALRELAGWYAQQAQAPAQLAVWRRIHSMALANNDAALEHEARTMVRALQILVGNADPVTRPGSDDAIRRGIARVAARGGG